jgi:hypothetical protein
MRLLKLKAAKPAPALNSKGMGVLVLKLIIKHCLNKVRNPLGLVLSALMISACSKVGQFKTQSPTELPIDQSSQHVTPEVPPPEAQPVPPATPSVPPVVVAPPTPLPPIEEYKPVALLWEAANTEAVKWSLYVQSMFKGVVKDTVNAADDMVRFCPKFNSLNENQKVNVWGMLVSAIVKYESGFDPTSRMKETTMGIDPVTGMNVYSEGLMQLSYQDITGWSFCAFNWSKDKFLSAKDPKKTILNPYINLDCGIRILAEQVARKHNIVVGSGAYWAVIKENGRYQKIQEIASLVKTVKFCN